MSEEKLHPLGYAEELTVSAAQDARSWMHLRK